MTVRPAQLSGDADELRQNTGAQILEGGVNPTLEALEVVIGA